MTATAWGFVAVAGVLAAGDWIVVSPGVAAKRVEYVAKPATMVALIGAAIALEPEHDAQRAFFVAGLLLSLAGDVFLMLPSDAFVGGLASFLLAHLSYIVGFAVAGQTAWAALGGAIVLVAGATIGSRIVRSVRSGEHRALVGPVAAYMTVISAMVVLAIGSGEPLAAAGALLFYCSDALIAWDRFVAAKRWARPAIMATYHLAQGALVISLAR
jgi:uncharacterized membrane protein YhhN